MQESLGADYWETSKALMMPWSTKMCQNSAPENENEKHQEHIHVTSQI